MRYRRTRAGGERRKIVKTKFVHRNFPALPKFVATMTAPLFLSACGSMSFGETLLDTAGVFLEASEIKRCYESGGAYQTCEGDRW